MNYYGDAYSMALLLQVSPWSCIVEWSVCGVLNYSFKNFTYIKMHKIIIIYKTKNNKQPINSGNIICSAMYSNKSITISV